jgi:hypothetical protein
MSATWFDLGARLRAAHDGAPTQVAAYSASLPINAPVAVLTWREGGQIHIEATDGREVVAAAGPDALAALTGLGVRLGAVHRTLVVADRATVSDLAALARTAGHEESASVIGWWDQRADHPGSGAVHMVVPAARARWVLGVAPEREQQLGTWMEWLGVQTEGATGLLELATITSGGPVLPGLLVMAEADSRSWKYHVERITTKGWDWRTSDTRKEAALGLATRNDATELFESLRLGDPMVAAREAWRGQVVTGHVVSHDDAHLVVEATAPLSRLRAGAEVAGWSGDPSRAEAAIQRLDKARIVSTSMSPAAVLTLVLTDCITRPGQFAPGQEVTLRPAPVSDTVQQRRRMGMSSRYSRSGNWLAGRGKPTVRRADVPFDVLLAAADD